MTSMNKEVAVIELVSPIGHPRIEAQAPRRAMDTPVGKRVGFIWNQYSVTRNFWPRLEGAIESLCAPPAVQRAYKSNTWMPLEKPKFETLAADVDYLVVGVGA
jgi:hypothetical protein